MTVPDIVRPNLSVIFCGINPGLYSAKMGQHFARPGNRFWKTLYLSGFTTKLLKPYDQKELLDYGLGITNFISRESRSAAELSHSEYKEGLRMLNFKILKYRPTWLAVLGIDAYKKAFSESEVFNGQQERTIGKTKIWLLPNPSGLNAHYSLPDLVELFKRFYSKVYGR